MAWKVTWYQDAVEVEDGRYGATRTWVEPSSAFTGLVLDFGLIQSTGPYSSGRRVYGLLLAHPESSKSVLLHADYDRIGDDVVAYYGEQLGKSLLES